MRILRRRRTSWSTVHQTPGRSWSCRIGQDFQDGLAGVYALVWPEDALRHRTQLEGLATAGDFAVASDRDSTFLGWSAEVEDDGDGLAELHQDGRSDVASDTHDPTR